MASFDEISRLQKRARDKEYRLRRQGARPELVAEESPRLSWQQVKKLSKRQRSKYARSLEKFNMRENHLVALESGELVDYNVLKRAESARKKWNVLASKEYKRIAALKDDAEKILKRKLYTYGTNMRGNVLGSITEIAPMRRPKTKEGAIKRAKTLEDMVSRTFASRRTMQRKNMQQILTQLGEYELAGIVGNMKSDNFDVLSSLTGIWDVLAIYYIPKEKDGRPRKQEFNADRAGSIADLIYDAQLYNLSADKAAKRMKNYARTAEARKEKAEKRVLGTE